LKSSEHKKIAAILNIYRKVSHFLAVNQDLFQYLTL